MRASLPASFPCSCSVLPWPWTRALRPGVPSKTNSPRSTPVKVHAFTRCMLNYIYIYIYIFKKYINISITNTGRREFQTIMFSGCFHSAKQIIKSFSGKINSLEQTSGLACPYFPFSGWGWPAARPPSPSPRSPPAASAQPGDLPWSQPFGPCGFSFASSLALRTWAEFLLAQTEAEGEKH